MKKFLKFSTAYFLLTLIVCFFNTVFGAELSQNTDILNGQFLLIHNRSSETVNTNDVPPPILDSDTTEEENPYIYENVSAIQEVDGETLYQLSVDYSDFEIEENIDLFASTTETELNDIKQFKSINYATNAYYSRPFTCYYISDCCEVFVENTLTFSPEDKATIATLIGYEFTNRIQPYLTTHLTEYTGIYGNKNGKIQILIQDILDNYSSTYSGYTAGYYFPGEKILHIDTYPLMKTSSSDTEDTVPTAEGVSKAFPTVSHEFTHLLEKSVTTQSPVWFSELLAISTETSLYESKTKAQQFTNYVMGKNYTRNGTVLNYSDYSVNNSNIGANYGLLYMFQHYLRQHTSLDENLTTNVFKNILSTTVSQAANTPAKYESAVYTAVNNSLNSSDYSFESFNNLKESFYIAYTLQEASGKYSFNATGDIALTSTYFSNSSELSLKPGAAAVIPLLGDDFSVPASDGLTYIAFSYSEATAPTSIDYPDKTHTILTKLGMTIPLLIISGTDTPTLSTRLFSEQIICDINRKNYKFSTDEITIRCQSLFDRNMYDIVTYRADTKSDITLNAYNLPEIDFEQNSLMFYPMISVASLQKKIYLRTAIYDAETDALLGTSDAELLPPSSTPNGFTPSIYAPSEKLLSAVNFKTSPSGKYRIKVFIMDANDKITPLGLAYDYFL